MTNGKGREANEKNQNVFREVPSEVKAIVKWFNDGGQIQDVTAEMEEFARGFLVALNADDALFPVSEQATWLLGALLTQHQRDPSQPIAWLNLGLALRRMALHSKSASAALKNTLLDRSLESLDRSLELEPTNPRAWRGRGLVFHMRAQYEEEAKCYRRALDIDSSDPHLWLLYLHALRAAGKEEEAGASIEPAYHAFLLAGQPEDLRDVFDGVGTPVRSDLTAIH